MDEIRKNINKLKEILGYELDYFYSERYPEIKKDQKIYLKKIKRY